MNTELNIELYEKLRKLSRRMHHMHHPAGPHRPMCMPHGPAGPGMFFPEGKTPEGRHPMPHHRRGLPRERILAIVNEHPEGIRQREIAEILMINPSSLSEAIDKLEADRYLERTVDPADRRATLITLTEKGRARAFEVEDERNEALNGFFSALTDEEKTQLCGLIDRLLETAEQPQ